MSTENEVVSQAPASGLSETSVDEMKKNAKTVMEQAVAASQKRSLEVSTFSCALAERKHSFHSVRLHRPF